MNERIKELAEQAKLSILLGDWTDEDTGETEQSRLEKFAELVVLRCCEIANAGNVGYNQVPAEVALDMTVKNIKAYFEIKD